MASNDVFKTIDLSLRIGELLLSSGAGAADVASAMSNVAYACGLRRFTADVTFTELAMSYQPSYDEPALIQMRHVRNRVTDYGDLTLVDHLMRELIRGDIDRDEAATRLNRIVSSGHALPRWAVTLGYGTFGAGVAVMLRGTPIVVAIAFLAAVGIDLIQRRMSQYRLPLFFQQVAGGLFATLLAVGAAALDIGVQPGRVITASIILLLSGVSFMGAIQDALTNYPMTAGARILEAVFATAGAIAGVSAGLSFAQTVGVRMGRLDPGVSALSSLPLLTVGAAVVAASFAFASYAPLRSLLPIGLIAAVATGLYDTTYQSGFGIATAAAAGAILVGVVSFSIAGRIRVPALVVVVAAVTPLLPGLSIFRGLSELADGREGGLLSLISAAAVAIALSAGVLFGEYAAQPLRHEAHRLETRLAGPRLVGPVRAITPHRRRTEQQRRKRRSTPSS